MLLGWTLPVFRGPESSLQGLSNAIRNGFTAIIGWNAGTVRRNDMGFPEVLRFARAVSQEDALSEVKYTAVDTSYRQSYRHGVLQRDCDAL